MQVVPTTLVEYSFIAREEIVTVNGLELELEFICEHFLASSHIKSYHLNVLSPQHKTKRSFGNRVKERQFEYSHENL